MKAFEQLTFKITLTAVSEKNYLHYNALLMHMSKWDSM